jgi:N-methylhydantoinase A
MDLRYVGQNYEIELPYRSDPAGIRPAFEARHRQLYGYATGESIECVNLRVAARLDAEHPPHPALSPGGEKERLDPLPPRGRGQGEGAGPVGAARAYFPETGEVTMPRYDRETLPAGVIVTGPAVIEDEWSTIVVYPGQRAVADGQGHLLLDLEAVA